MSQTNSFKGIFLTETWLINENSQNNYLFQIPNYIAIHQIRKCLCKGGGIAVFIHNSLLRQVRHDLKKAMILLKLHLLN